MDVGSGVQITFPAGFFDGLFAPPGQFGDSLRMIFGNELFRAYVIGVLSVAENLPPDINPENILPDAVSGHMARIVIMGDT